MNLLHLAYNLVAGGCAPALLPSLWLSDRIRGRDPDRFYQRLGYYPAALRRQIGRRPRIWLHAVSVGEVGVSRSIIEALRASIPDCRIAVSTTTEQGLLRARSILGSRILCFYAPLDLNSAVRRALCMFKPDLLAVLETEIWPNLIISAKRMGVRTAFLNGRISGRTIRGYRRILPLMRYTFGHVDRFSMISEQDADRILSLGAPPERVEVSGNAKFDAKPAGRADARCWAAHIFSLAPETPLIVAGSTRYPEEKLLIRAYREILRRFPQAVLVIAPRHLGRVGQVEQWLSESGLAFQRRSALETCQSRNAPVVILDTMGELADIYSAASFVFCGGSLVPKGGQNLLEPAMWGKPVMYGPSMEDFAAARDLIERAGGGATVRNVHQVIAQALVWLEDPERAAAAGGAARDAISPHRGAARRHAAVIRQLI